MADSRRKARTKGGPGDAARVEESEQTGADGRRLRGKRSRKQIIDALFALIRSGDLSPSASRVADYAGVSLRTVFRHFEDMESLNREMAAEMDAEIMPFLLKPYETTGWRDRLDEQIGRRAAIFERILPVKTAAALRRHRSDFLKDDHERFLAGERSTLIDVLPGSVRKASVDGTPLTAALEMAVSFLTWQRMRQEQGLDPATAEAVMRLTVDRLLGALPPGAAPD